MQIKRGGRGFTLAELLIVMAIIVVLAAVAIPTFGRQLETARETTDIELIRNAYTDALSLAIMDAADGTLDGNRGTLAMTPTTPVDFKIKATSTANECTFEMKLAEALKQKTLAWQYIDSRVGGQVVDTVATAGDQYVVFTFALDTATGAVALKASTNITTAAAFSN